MQHFTALGQTVQLPYSLIQEESVGPGRESLQSKREGQEIQKVITVGDGLMEKINVQLLGGGKIGLSEEINFQG